MHKGQSHGYHHHLLPLIAKALVDSILQQTPEYDTCCCAQSVSHGLSTEKPALLSTVMRRITLLTHSRMGVLSAGVVCKQLHGTMNCYSEHHLVTICSFFCKQ
jgi:hypothetical protein